jgi:23S rRNA (cytosine1962-C5)-methyltransferase
VLQLRPGHAPGHPWIYRNQIADSTPGLSAGDLVTVIDAGGAVLGRGFYNPRPALACRLLSDADEVIDAAFFARRIRDAVAYRRALGYWEGDIGSAAAAKPPPERRLTNALPGHRRAKQEAPGDTVADGHPRGDAGAHGEAVRDGSACRLVWSEADRLPGLVVDRYGPILVVQCLTLGMARTQPWIMAGLRAALGPRPIYLLDDPLAARIEGFEPRRGWLDEPGPDTIAVTEGTCRFIVRPGEGHKTGFYLDQAENRRLVAGWAVGHDVLDAFCYTGAFAAHALARGARRALCIESSRDVLAQARENLELNGAAGRAELIEGNAFDELRRLERERARFGLVILDPPPFTRSKAAVEAAARGYKEVTLRALRLLGEGGVLATFSCSHHISPARFEEICRAAAQDAGVTVRVLAELGQSPDHPVLLTVPETRYLKGLLLEVVQARPVRRARGRELRPAGTPPA